MNYSRRDLGLLLPAFAAASAGAQPNQLETLTSKVYHDDQIPYKGNEQKKAREFFHGTTHSGFNLEMHETVLGPGVEAHPPHKHEHEEIVQIMQGTVEANLAGERQSATAGSVVFFGSNQMHNLRNSGTTPCRYYVLELRGKEA